MEKENSLSTAPIGRLLLQFSIPTALTLMVNYLYNLADQFFVGQKAGYLGIGATNVAFPLNTLCAALALLLGDGCAANISLHLGRQEYDAANRTLGSTVTLLLCCGAGMVLVGNLFLSSIVRLFGATDAVFDTAMTYARIILFGLPFSMCCIALTAIIRADGSPRYTMRCMMLGAGINLVLDPIFIFKLDMGVTGAAIATIIGQIVSGLLCLARLPKLQNVHCSLADLKPDKAACREVLTLGLPSFFTQISAAATQISMNNLMSRYGAGTVYGSEIPLSCYGMVMKIYQIAHAMFVGLASGTQPINGFNYGAQQYDRVRRTCTLALKWSLLISCGWYLAFQLLAGRIGSWFVPDDALYSQFTRHFLRLYMAAFFLYGPPQTVSSFFQAIEQSGKAMAVSLSRQVCFLLPLAFLLARFHGLDGALLAAPIADVLAFGLSMLLVTAEFRRWKRLGRL